MASHISSHQTARRSGLKGTLNSTSRTSKAGCCTTRSSAMQSPECHSTAASPYPEVLPPPYTTRVRFPAATILVPPPKSHGLPPDQAQAAKLHARFSTIGIDRDPSLTNCLFHPCSVELGAVGYVHAATGAFVTLFHAHRPETFPAALIARGVSYMRCGSSGNGQLRSISQTFNQHPNHVVEKVHPVAAWLGLKVGTRHRGYNWDVSADCCKKGRPLVASLARISVYSRLDGEDEVCASSWLDAHMDAIWQVYGPVHDVRQDEIILVTRRLQADAWSLFVKISADQQDNVIYFMEDPSPQAGRPWGWFSRSDKKMISPGSAITVVQEVPLRRRPTDTWDTLALSGLTCTT